MYFLQPAAGTERAPLIDSEGAASTGFVSAEDLAGYGRKIPCVRHTKPYNIPRGGANPISCRAGMEGRRKGGGKEILTLFTTE